MSLKHTTSSSLTESANSNSSSNNTNTADHNSFGGSGLRLDGGGDVGSDVRLRKLEDQIATLTASLAGYQNLLAQMIVAQSIQSIGVNSNDVSGAKMGGQVSTAGGSAQMSSYSVPVGVALASVKLRNAVSKGPEKGGTTRSRRNTRERNIENDGRDLEF
jgi:hypothetical protein